VSFPSVLVPLNIICFSQLVSLSFYGDVKASYGILVINQDEVSEHNLLWIIDQWTPVGKQIASRMFATTHKLLSVNPTIP
jgi:hypothetical protein